jgi:hypothetical protein
VITDKWLTHSHCHITDHRQATVTSPGTSLSCYELEFTSSNFSSNALTGGTVCAVFGAPKAQFLHFEGNSARHVLHLKADQRVIFPNCNFIASRASTYLIENACFALVVKKCAFAADTSQYYISGFCIFTECMWDVPRKDVLAKCVNKQCELNTCEFGLAQTVDAKIQASKQCWAARDGGQAPSRRREERWSASKLMAVGFVAVVLGVVSYIAVTRVCPKKTADTQMLMYV